jgi:imidazoleglycerol-phosphate dehydratase/histidinol-phosphatase
VGLVMDYLRGGVMDFSQSYVIGDRSTDMQLAKNMGVRAILYEDKKNWLGLAQELLQTQRCAQLRRATRETIVAVALDLPQTNINTTIQINTGIGFFDHMLEQLAKHAGFNLTLTVQGDLQIDEHHTVEDCALTLGQALRQALGDKRGIQRYGFLLPMDEALAQVALDLSGRSFFKFDGQFNREKVGNLPTELIAHFFRSLAEGLGAALHIQVTGENAHHMIESIFKGVGRALRQAIWQQGHDLPTTKGTI